MNKSKLYIKLLEPTICNNKCFRIIEIKDSEIIKSTITSTDKDKIVADASAEVKVDVIIER